MAQECGFFNAELEGGEYDRVYNAEQFAAYFASFIGNGIFGNSMSELVVVENETPNMSVNVSSGKAWINGWWYRNTEDYNLSVDVADGILNRIDIVVLRWGNVERDMWLQVIKGTPSAEPTAPSITRDADYYDLKLCEVSVPAGAINIRQAQITDTRAISDVCGFVTGLIDQIDATDLFLQFQAQFGDFMNVSFEEFDVWFQHMKDQLSEDAAGHLQQEIDEITGSMVAVEECTDEEYDVLSQAEKHDGKIRIVGDQDGQIHAAVIKYDNTESGMSARNVQAAIDEIHSDFSAMKDYVSVVADGSSHIGILLNRLAQEVDWDRVTYNSYIVIQDSNVFRLQVNAGGTPTTLMFAKTEIAGANLNYNQIFFNTTNSSFYSGVSGSIVDVSSTVILSSGKTIRFYYGV